MHPAALTHLGPRARLVLSSVTAGDVPAVPKLGRSQSRPRPLPVSLRYTGTATSLIALRGRNRALFLSANGQTGSGTRSAYI